MLPLPVYVSAPTNLSGCVITVSGRVLAIFSGRKPSGGGNLKGFCPVLRTKTDVPEEHAQCGAQSSVIATLGV